MNKKVRYLFGIFLTISMGTILMWFLCCNVNTIDPPREVIPAVESQEIFSINEDGTILLTNSDRFIFNNSDFTIVSPISTTINEGIEKLKTYLSQENHSNKVITITGLYDISENNPSAFPNLGIARANAVKNYFVSKEINSKKISITGKQQIGLADDSLTYKEFVIYSIGDQQNQEINILKETINKDPLVLYFKNAQTSINLSIEQRKKIANISRYLDKVDGTSITIEGHTDAIGDRSTNINIGYIRANFLKEYFVSNGIAESKIKIASRGPDVPIASNVTKEGRSKNRRVIIILNQDNNSQN